MRGPYRIYTRAFESMIILDRQHPVRNPGCPAIEQSEDKTIVVADFEFSHDRERREAYLENDGSSAASGPRWPFDKIVCASWVVIRFPAGAIDTPEVGRFHSLRAPELDEIDIVDHFFRRALEEETSGNGEPARLVSWAGGYKDDVVLRDVAMEWGIVAPPQLRNPAKDCPLRLDLCEAFYTPKIGGVHLSELAQAQGLPGKAIPATQLKKHIETGNWALVEEQCAGDVLLTAIIAARYLATLGEIGQTGKACTKALIERFCERAPTDYTRMWKQWSKENLRDTAARIRKLGLDRLPA